MRCSAFGGQPYQWPCAPVTRRATNARSRPTAASSRRGRPANARPAAARRAIDSPAACAASTAARPSVPEVAHAGEHHRDAALVGGGDHLVVAHRAARLDHAGWRRHRPPRRGRRGTGRRRRSRPPSRAATGRRSAALMLAMRAESTRLIWPAPTPSVMPSPQNTIALLLTYLATFQANSRSLQLLRRRLRACVTTFSSATRELVVVGGLHQQAGADALDVERVAAVLPGGLAARRQRDLQQAHVRLGARRRAQRLGRERRARSALRRTASRRLRRRRRRPRG